MAAAIRHLHDFAREVDLKPDEWLAGIAFLTAVGQACTPYRQEFILLSDVLGLSRLVNVMHDATGREAAGTETSLLGPFFREKAPEFAARREHRRALAPTASELVLFGKVTDAEGQPVPDAEIDIWQTDAHGPLRPAGQRPRGDGPARPLPHRCRRALPHAHGQADRLFHPDGRAGGQDGAAAAPPRHAAGAYPCAGRRRPATASWSPRSTLGDDPNIDSDTVFGVSNSLVVTPAMGLPGAPRSRPAGGPLRFPPVAAGGGRNRRTGRRRSIADDASGPVEAADDFQGGNKNDRDHPTRPWPRRPPPARWRGRRRRFPRLRPRRQPDPHRLLDVAVGWPRRRMAARRCWRSRSGRRT